MSSQSKDSSWLSSPQKSVIAGAMSGGCTRMIAAPLDLLKIRYQLDTTKIIRQPSSSSKLLRVVKSVYLEEGIFGFWRGNLAATQLWISYAAVQFGGYQLLASSHGKSKSDHNITTLGLIGGVAAAGATTVTYPFDLLRTIFAGQGTPRIFPNMQSLIRHTWRHSGPLGFYQGFLPSFAQVVPYMGLSFATYEALRRNSDLSPSVCGGIAGLVSKTAVYPMDTVKKRMQMQVCRKQNPTTSAIPSYSNTLDCIKSIIRDEGALALYRGTVPSVLKAVCAHSLSFAIYEASLRFLD